MFKIKSLLWLCLTLLCLFSLPTAAHAQSSTTTIRGTGLQPLVEERGSTQTLNIYGPGGVIIAQVATDSSVGGTPIAKTRYLLHDHLGSTRLVLDSNNQVLGSFDYSPFGETTPTGNVADVAYRYTGQEVNGALGTYNYHARHYDAEMGRFLRVDPARYNASPYLYANDNPVNFVDQTGQQPILWLISNNMLLDDIHRRDIKELSALAHTLNIPAGHGPLEYENLSGSVPQGNFSLFINTHGTPNGFKVQISSNEQKELTPKEFAEFVYQRLTAENLPPKAVESIFLWSCRSGCERNGVSAAERFFQHLLEKLPNLKSVTASPYDIAIRASHGRTNLIFFSRTEGRSPREMGLYTSSDPEQFFAQTIDETVLRANRASLLYLQKTNDGSWVREREVPRLVRGRRLRQGYSEPLLRTYTRAQVEQRVLRERPPLSIVTLPER